MKIKTFFIFFYLYKLHHRDWVEEVKATESVQPVGGAGDVSDGQGGCVAGKDGVSTTHNAEKQMLYIIWRAIHNKSRRVPFRTFYFIIL